MYLSKMTLAAGLVASLGLVALTNSTQAAPSGEAIARKMEALDDGYGDMVGEVEMRLSNQAGEHASRRFTLKLLERTEAGKGDYSLVVFQSPADLKGTALLTHVNINAADDQWLYLPALRRVKRISSAKRDGAFLGSEFSYEDLGGHEVAEHAWRYVAEGKCRDNKTCYKLEAKPKDDASGYSKRIVYVEKGTYRIQKVVFFDRRGEKVKALKYDQYQKVGGGFWRAHRWHMKNYRSGKETLVSFTSLQLKQGLSESDFNKARLKSGH